MSLDTLYQWLEATGPATAIRENALLFPTIESTHVVAITLVFGTIATIDLRLLCFASLATRVSRLTASLLPWTWGAFIVAALTGSLLFISNATAYAHNSFFQAKLLLMVGAALNMVMFHWLGSRDIASWDALPRTPARARVAGALSLLIWISVVACGRWIGFTMLRLSF
jgi:cbb3-type cytochrome oxidase subunit 1